MGGFLWSDEAFDDIAAAADLVDECRSYELRCVDVSARLEARVCCRMGHGF